MLRELKVCLAGVLMIAASARTASAFALTGPGSGGDNTGNGGAAAAETWQVPEIGYVLSPADFGSYAGADIGSPRNVGEEYRWNTPVLYYAADSTFLVDAFGVSNGLAAVDAAFAVLNGALSNGVSAYSSTLSEVPLRATRINPRAAALGLLDLKTVLVSTMLEELGLSSAERWTWCLHDRAQPENTTCPNGTVYQVVRRNFDPVTGLQTNYVNGTLYTYRIMEICDAVTGNEVADAFEVPVDSNLLNINSALASVSLFNTRLGAYCTGLSRDDVGGLRYLLRPGNLNNEALPGSFEQISGGGGGLVGTTNLTFLVTSDLADLVSASFTNSDAALLALFPNLVISSSSAFPALVVSSNTFAYFTNYPQAPYGSPASLVTGVTYTTNVAFRYNRAFGNVVTNSYHTNGLVTVITTNVAVSPQAPYGSPATTNVSSTTTVQSFVNGDYYFTSVTNCGFNVISNMLTQVIPIATTIAATNAAGTTDLNGQSFAQTTVTYFTNHTLLVAEVICPGGTTNGGATNGEVALRYGMDRMRFIRADYDGLIGLTWSPRTNIFTLVSIMDNTTITQAFRRTITQPDILIRASDQNGNPGDEQFGLNIFSRSVPGYSPGPGVTLPAGLGGTLAGPGTISGRIFLTFNKGTPAWFNQSPFFMAEGEWMGINYVWGSFDGRTNAPVIYPEAADIQNVENNVLMQIAPPTLPAGQVGVFYSQQLTGVGGTGGFVFSLSGAGLPSGLNLSSSGLISGTPTSANTYDFTIHMVDAGLRPVDVPYSITINP